MAKSKQTATSKIVKALNVQLKELQTTDPKLFEFVQKDIKAHGIKMGVTSGKRSGGKHAYVRNLKTITPSQKKVISRYHEKLLKKQPKEQSEVSKAIKRINRRIVALENAGLKGSGDYQRLIASLTNSGFTVSETRPDKEGMKHAKIANSKYYTYDQEEKLKQLADRKMSIIDIKKRAAGIINAGKDKEEQINYKQLTKEQLESVLALEYETETNISKNKDILYRLEAEGILSFRLRKDSKYSNEKNEDKPVNNGKLTQAQLLEIQNAQTLYAEDIARLAKEAEAELVSVRGEALP